MNSAHNGCRTLRQVCLGLGVALLSACATNHEPPPIGAETVGPTSYEVDTKAVTLQFNQQGNKQVQNGLEISLSAANNSPVLFYRYQISEKDNGDYVLYMPNPPKLYSVFRIPFYKNDPQKVVVRFTLTNNTSGILNANDYMCTFALDGKGGTTQPLNAGTLLPGQNTEVSIKGPELKELEGHHVLGVWVYRPVTSNQQGNLPYKWDLPYTLSVKTSMAEAHLVVQSPIESRVSQYKGLVEPADTGN